MNLITEEPLWYLPLCLLIGALYAGVLYFRSRQFDDVAAAIRVVMAGARFVLVSLLCFFLLKPLLTSIFRQVEKPVVIVAQDVSESLLIGPDSSYYREEYRQQLEKLTADLEEDYEVATFSFGDQTREGLSFDFTDKQTDLSDLIETLYNQFSNRNVGAVIVGTDGILNRGRNPLYMQRKLSAPLYTIALGDTSVKRDLLISEVGHNRLAYLGNQFPLEIVVDAHRFAGKEAVVTVEQDGKELFTQTLQIQQSHFSMKVPVLLEAEEIGIQKYTVRLNRLGQEVSYVNNQTSVYIDVLDGRQKILILAASPHPDIAALRSSMAKNENYEVESMLIQDFTGNPVAYNLIVLHQIPTPKQRAKALLASIKDAGVPVFYVLGGNTNLPDFNNQLMGLNIRSAIGKTNDCQAVLAPDFSLFTLSKETSAYLGRFPPLKTPFGSYKNATAAQVLLRQKIGLVETDQPLLLFHSTDEQKAGVLAGEGLWRWKLADFQEHGNHNIFDELVGKVVQFLSVKEDKSYFRVFSRNSFLENESIIFEAETYNESYELVNDGAVSLKITDSEGNTFPFGFSPNANGFRLDAGLLPEGEYTYVAETELNGKLLSEQGVFTVSPVQVESVTTTADHQFLYNLAAQNNGELLAPSDLESLSEKLRSRDDIKPVSYSQRQLRDLINLQWIFFILLGLLSLEWFLRKRSGSY